MLFCLKPGSIPRKAQFHFTAAEAIILFPFHRKENELTCTRVHRLSMAVLGYAAKWHSVLLHCTIEMWSPVYGLKFSSCHIFKAKKATKIILMIF